MMVDTSAHCLRTLILFEVVGCEQNNVRETLKCCVGRRNDQRKECWERLPAASQHNFHVGLPIINVSPISTLLATEITAG